MRNSMVPGQAPLAPAEISTSGLEPYAEPPYQNTGSNNISRLISALRRFRWVIAGLSLLGIAGGIVATRFIEPEYEVSARILIEPPTGNRVGAPIQGDELLEAKAWIELLTTFKVLDPVVRERKLFVSPGAAGDARLFKNFELASDRRWIPGKFELAVDKNGKTYELKQRSGLYTEKGSVGDSIGLQLGFKWVPELGKDDGGRDIKFEVISPREASVALTRRLVPTLREMNFLHLTLRDTDPEAAALTMNALIRQFVNEAAAQKRSKLTMLAEILDSQVADQDRRLKDAEQRLESFRVGTVTMPREDVPIASGLSFTQPTVYGSYFSQRNALDSLRRDRKEIEDVLRRTKTGEVAVDAFNTITSVRQAPDLQRVLNELSGMEAQLRDSVAMYTDQHPGTLRLKTRIGLMRTQTIPLYAEALIRQLENREREAETRIGIASRELQSIPVRTQTEARLRREADQSASLYGALENSRQQAKLAEASAIPDVRILDSAEPPTKPVRGGSVTLILLGLLIGLGSGIAIALLIDRFDPRFRYPDQVSKGLGLPILGTIPEIKRAKGQNASQDEAAQVVEAFRSIRMSLAHSFDPSGPIVLTISSPGPGDGKSLIASNLALSFAEAGYQTVLLDGDIRRGSLHHTFGVERRPGLVDHLAGDASLTAILRPATHALLTLIPCGSRRHLGPELLGSARMRELMTHLKSTYQVVIVDTPPLGAGIDPFVLSTATGHLAIVLRAGETDRQLAEAKLQILDRLPVRLLGAILNDVRLKEGAYKYYRYSYGYVADVEEEETVQVESGARPG
jgi:capsular exopolysaccharide synthesis family protein